MRHLRDALSRGFTVGQMRKEMEHLPDDTPFVFVCDYGDYHHTMQALPAEDVEVVKLSALKDSAYSQSGIALIDEESRKDGPRDSEIDEDEDIEIFVAKHI